jgi:lysophospholipase L1-like esterase
MTYLLKLKYIFKTLLLAILLVVGTGEIGLRIGGFFYKNNVEKTYHSQGKTNIICIGESTTFMGGESSYPKILQKKLDKAFPNKYHIINAGVPGVLTEYFRDRIDQLISTFKPEIAILMLGINDYEATKELKDKTSFLDKVLRSSYLLSWINNFKEFNRFITPGPYYVTLPNYIQLKISKLRPHVVKNSQEFIEALYLNDYKKYKKLFYENIKNNPSQLTFALSLAYYAATNNEELLIKTIKYFKQKKIKVHIQLLDLLIVQPLVTSLSENSILRYQYYQLLDKLSYIASNTNQLMRFIYQTEVDYLLDRRSFHLEDTKTLAVELEKLIQNRTTSMFPIKPTILQASVNTIINLLNLDKKQIKKHPLFVQKKSIENVNYILSQLKKNQTKVFMMQYPLRPIERLKKTFKSDYYVENFTNFTNKLKTVEYDKLFIDRFAYNFGHTTKLGSTLISDAIFAELIKSFPLDEEILPSKKEEFQ